MSNEITQSLEQPKQRASDGWDWYETLVAELAVAADCEARRVAAENQRAIDAETEEFIAAYRYAARVGLLEFNIRFLKTLYGMWRYGLDEDDAFR